LHENRGNFEEKRTPMIRYRSQKILTSAQFNRRFQTALDKNNRWVKLSACIPWHEQTEAYYHFPSDIQGRLTKVPAL
jgi:IS5 family transposase